MLRHQNQKNPRVRKISVRNSGAGNGCVNFMDARKNAFTLQEKPMSIKFFVLGGGGFWVFLGGGECRFYFYGRADFSDKNPIGAIAEIVSRYRAIWGHQGSQCHKRKCSVCRDTESKRESLRWR